MAALIFVLFSFLFYLFSFLSYLFTKYLFAIVLKCKISGEGILTKISD